MARHYIKHYGDDGDPVAEAREREQWAARDRQARSATEDTVYVPARPKRAQASAPRVQVVRNERTYRQGSDPLGRQFTGDVVAATLWQDPESVRRLARHMDEERIESPALYGMQERAGSGTSNFGGLVVPSYLVQHYGPSVQALRPFADICTPIPLPDHGISVNLATITTPSTAAVQATENTTVATASPATTMITEQVTTIAGYVDLSRQLFERSAVAMDVVLLDLMRAHATALDSQLINAATGLTGLAVTTTFTGTTPMALYSKLLASAAGVRAALKGIARPDYALVTGTRWDWFSSQGGATWPLVQESGAADGGATYSGAVGKLPNGFGVLADDNISSSQGASANQDSCFIVASADCLLLELPGGPVVIRADQVAAASLGVRLVMESYVAWSFRRHANSVGVVSGTGLVTPAFA